MKESRLIKRILVIDRKLSKTEDTREKMKLEKQRYELVERIVKLKLKKNE